MHPIWYLTILLIVPLLLRGVLLKRRREARALREFARKNRLTFSPQDSIAVRQRYDRLEILQQGHSRSAGNLLYGTGETGHITLFNYAYDLGFGMHRIRRQWWIAVIETQQLHEPWRAAPVDSDEAADYPHPMGDFRLSADRAATLGQLQARGIDELLKSTTEKYWWEVSGPLVAVAMADDSKNVSLDRLLETCSRLSIVLLRD